MKILLALKDNRARPLAAFFNSISEGLCLKIFNKFQSYVEHGTVYHCKQLKTLNARIWKYKGTIYKLRVDHGRESARVLFAKTKAGDLTLIHAFLKTTRKTPAKDARQAIAVYQILGSVDTIVWDNPAIPLSG